MHIAIVLASYGHYFPERCKWLVDRAIYLSLLIRVKSSSQVFFLTLKPPQSVCMAVCMYVCMYVRRQTCLPAALLCYAAAVYWAGLQFKACTSPLLTLIIMELI
jgi:hypothetical protein